MAEKTLLLINDENTALKTLARILGREYKVLPYLDPLEAWKYLELGGQADLLVADLYMPKLDGISLLRFLKNSEKDHVASLPVIISSTIAGGEDVEELAVQTGASGFLGLPLKPKELLANVAHILQGDFSGPVTDVAFITSSVASPLVEALKGLLPDEFEVRVLDTTEATPEELVDVEIVVLTDDLDNIEELLAELSKPGRVFVLIVFSLSKSSSRVQYLMEFGADAVINSAISRRDFYSTVRLCARQRSWYRIMERRYLDQDYSVEG